MANVTKTTTDVFLGEMWSDAVLEFAQKRMQLRNQITDFSALATGVDRINIPQVKEDTKRDKSADSAVTYDANTDTSRTIPLDQHIYEAKRIEDIANVQSNQSLFEVYASSMGYSLAKGVEAYLAGKIQGHTQNLVTLATDDIILPAELRSGLELLLDQNYDYTDGDTFFYANPKAYMGLLGQGDFTEAQKRGDTINPIASGSVIEIYGMPVYPSTDWSEGGVNISGSVFKRESVYYAEQFGVRSQSAYDIDHLATSVVVDMLFGATLSHPEENALGGIVNFKNAS
jgi:hypothetical protein|tara:strand:+ start:483 stop:1340 length:858 start_codon:yes stop_codon:yes gene_type:complete